MHKSPQKIFIYGVPGSGKTYISKKLSKILNLPVIEGDKIKSLARKGKPKDKFPFLYLGTSQAFGEFGKLSEETAIKGLLAVRETLKEFVKTEVDKQHGKGFILEAAFLDPNLLKNSGEAVLITVPDKARHKRQFLSHREKVFDFSGSEFKAARIVQEYLVPEAKGLNIPILVNDDRLDESIANLFLDLSA